MDGGQRGCVLTLSCPDAPGIVYAASRFLVEQDCTIVQSQQFGDPRERLFFPRVHFDAVSGDLDVDALRRRFAAPADRFAMTWRMQAAAVRQRVLIMVSRHGHCLNDLLFRQSTGALQIDVPAVVSNHRDFAGLVENYGIPFFHVPVTPETKPAAESRLLQLCRGLEIDLVVLARYMQVLSDRVCTDLANRVINIHHSMLPSFSGARPYHQAYDRGVKVIGATAHYVTAGLDEGPIIEQEVARIDHAMTAAEVTAVGRDAECQALARAVRWHVENRIMLAGVRTVVLR